MKEVWYRSISQWNSLLTDVFKSLGDGSGGGSRWRKGGERDVENIQQICPTVAVLGNL